MTSHRTPKQAMSEGRLKGRVWHSLFHKSTAIWGLLFECIKNLCSWYGLPLFRANGCFARLVVHFNCQHTRC